MSWLLDTNLLLRLADAQSPEHAVAEAAIEHLIARQESVFISAQVLVEFWAVATRPESVNGLGWSFQKSWIAGSNWSTAFRSPASIRTTPSWQLCCSCMEFVSY